MAFSLGPRALSAGYRLAAFDSIGSTNAEALSRARGGERGPIWFVTAQQTAGRGRRHRPWIAPRGNLASSVMEGIGPNVLSAPEGTPTPATSLAALGVNISAEELFATLSDAWAEFRALWDDGRGFGEIRRLWLARAAGLGQKVTVRNGGSTVEGTFDTLDEAGCMVIRTSNGGRVAISAGDVYFGSAASAGAV